MLFWTANDSPYIAQSQITVSSGVTLTLQPGTVVKFKPATGITASGQLSAVGAAGKNITFTSIRDDSVSGDTNGDGSASLPAPGDWVSISGTNVVLDHTVVKYGGNSPMINGGLVKNSHIAYSAGDGIVTAQEVAGNTVEDNLGVGINITDSQAIRGNTVTGNGVAMQQRANRSPVISGSIAYNNGVNAVLIPGSDVFNLQVTWKADLPFVIDGQVYLSRYTGYTGESGLTLTPGSIVKLKPGSNFIVGGAHLTATGTVDNQTVFTSFKDDSVGGDTNNDGAATAPAPGDWKNIFVNGGPATLDHTILRYGGGGTGINAMLEGQAGLTATNSTIAYSAKAGITSNQNVTGNTVEHNVGYGLSQSGGTATGNVVRNNAHGIQAGGSALIATNTVEDNTGNGIYVSYSAPAVRGNIITGNNAAINQVPAASPVISNNVVSGNQLNAVLVPGGDVFNTKATWKADLPFVIDGGVRFNSYTTGLTSQLTITPGSIVKFKPGSSVSIVWAYLTATGTVDNQTVFTSFKDDSVGGDTNNDGAASVPAPGDWRNLVFSGYTSSLLDHAIVRYGGGGTGVVAMIEGPGGPTVTNSTITYSATVGINTSQNVTGNVIEHNVGYGIQSDNTVITGNIIRRNGGGIKGNLPNATITRNHFELQDNTDIYNTGSGWPSFFGNYSGGPELYVYHSYAPAADRWQPDPSHDRGESASYNLGSGRCHAGYSRDPVNTSNGNFTYDHEDIRLSGKGLALVFKRSYNSLDNAYNGFFGHGWTHNYNVNLRFDDTSHITAMYPDGQRVQFTQSGGNNYTAPPRVLGKLVKNGNGTYSLTFIDQTKYNFDANGRLTAQIDKYGNTTTLTYNVNGYLDRVTDPSSRYLSLSYNSSFYITQVSDSTGRSVSFGYDQNGNLTSFTDARSKVTTYSYDADDQLTEIKEPGAANPIVKNQYENGKVVKQIDAFDATQTLSYDTVNKKTTLTDNRGNVSIHEYDDLLRLIKSTDPSTAMARNIYGDLDRPLQVVDKNNNSMFFGYDANGDITETIDQESHGTRAGYDLTNNNILWTKNALGKQTTFDYDASGKLLESVTSPIGATLFDYYSDGSLKTLTDDNSHATNFAYNTAGNLTKITDSLNDSSTMEYDTVGRMTATTDGEGNKSQYSYDAGGNILNIKDPLALVFPSERHKVDFTYDARGNQNSFKDANNNLTSFGYDDMNSLTSVVDALESTTTYGYDPDYNLSSVRDAEGHATNYNYSGNDMLTAITDPLSKTVNYSYDPAGNLKKVLYPSGDESYFDYFTDNLLKSLSYKNEATSYAFEYNPVHSLSKVVDNEGNNWLFGYDEGNRLTATTESINPTLGSFPIGRAYDGVSNLTAVKAGSDSTVTYGYNERDDLATIDLPGDFTDEIRFGQDKARKRTGIVTPGSTSLFSYNEASRITTVINETSSSTTRYDYTHDANGNTLSENNTGYDYDVLNRLTGWYNPLTDTTTTYGYDKVGNLLEVKEGQTVTKSFTYNAANQISSAGFDYDANGNMIEDPDKHYVYDVENRLKQVTLKSTSQTIAAYAYDFMGRRISSTDASSSTTYFHYDGWNVVAESDGSGTVTANYYYDNKGQITAMKRDNQMYYYQFNAHGDVVALTDSSVFIKSGIALMSAKKRKIDVWKNNT